MSKYLVNYGIINYYTVAIEAASPEAAERKVADLMPTELEDLDAEFQGWDFGLIQADEDPMLFED